jgi:pantoate--beta-alanine ligase
LHAFKNTKMIIIRTLDELSELIKSSEYASSAIGFVPTMGALHEGHGSLITSAKKDNHLVICSIFVNPTQFNKAEDLEKYPRKEKEDISILEELGCDFLFIPTTEEIYKNYKYVGIDLKELETVMEGKFRPGHFQGVCEIVYRLFDLVKPTRAYFGLKDFQQVAVIKYMTSFFNLPVEIIACPTIREQNGLALSSRNLRLSDTEKQDALIIFNTLDFIKKNLNQFETISKLKTKALQIFNQGKLTLEYLEIVDQSTLTVQNDHNKTNLVACIAAYCNHIRLIDNIIIS